MIRNEQEHQITTKALSDLQDGFAETVLHVAHGKHHDATLAAAQISALHSQIVELHEQLADYRARMVFKERLSDMVKRIDSALDEA